MPKCARSRKQYKEASKTRKEVFFVGGNKSSMPNANGEERAT